VASAAVVLAFAACDSDIGGSAAENRPPNTELSVRDASLVDNLSEEDRLPSTVMVSWAGTDPDGYVQSFELRYFAETDPPGAEDGWSATIRNDSLIQLPLGLGESTANVVFEVRAVDNEGAVDETPARTIFPIRNSPPTLRFDPSEIPPDTTFAIFSVGFFADDPEGTENIARLEISLNDSVSFVPVPSDVNFITLVGQVDKSDPAQAVTDARVYLGRGFQSSDIVVPGLRLADTNTLYARAVDLTDTSSARVEHTWHVKKSNSNVLFVNDYRASATTSRLLQSYHLGILTEYLPAGSTPDIWDISSPYFEIQSPLLPPSADPALRVMLAGYDYIYWITTNSTNSITDNNFPFAASALGDFLAADGRILVHSPVLSPADPEQNLGNPAVIVLPFSDFITFPDSLISALRVVTGASVAPSPGAPAFPELRATATILNTFPFVVETGTTLPMLEAEYQYRARNGNTGTWFGSSTVASISADRKVGLFALPLVSTFNGSPYFVGADGDPEAPRTVVKMMLEELGFPQ
jgi:hypothetical protein